MRQVRAIVREARQEVLPLEALAPSPRDADSSAPGLASFGLGGAGRCGVAAFSRAARPLWRAFGVEERLPGLAGGADGLTGLTGQAEQQLAGSGVGAGLCSAAQ